MLREDKEEMVVVVVGGDIKGHQSKQEMANLRGGGEEQTRGGDAECCEGENKEPSGEMRPAHGGGAE